MKILFDYQIACIQKYGGVSRYHYELMQGLNRIDGVKAGMGILYSANYYFRRGLFRDRIRKTGKPGGFRAELIRRFWKANFIWEDTISSIRPGMTAAIFLQGRKWSLPSMI